MSLLPDLRRYSIYYRDGPSDKWMLAAKAFTPRGAVARF